MVASWRDNFSATWIGAASRTSIPRPDTPKYNGVAERALGLLREKAIILIEKLDVVINVPREKLWAQTMLFACDVTNKSRPTIGGSGDVTNLCPFWEETARK